MKALVFDTETNGLVKTQLLPLTKQPSIIEFYGCLADLETGEIIEEIDQLIKPPGEISEEITRITGLDAASVAGAPIFADQADRLRAFIEQAPLIIAHNASFDREMIDVEFERLGQTLAWPRVICTVEQTIHLVGYRLNLSALYQHLFGEAFPNAHRAKNDVIALLRCCVELHRLGEI